MIRFDVFWWRIRSALDLAKKCKKFWGRLTIICWNKFSRFWLEICSFFINVEAIRYWPSEVVKACIWCILFCKVLPIDSFWAFEQIFTSYCEGITGADIISKFIVLFELYCLWNDSLLLKAILVLRSRVGIKSIVEWSWSVLNLLLSWVSQRLNKLWRLS